MAIVQGQETVRNPLLSFHTAANAALSMTWSSAYPLPNFTDNDDATYALTSMAASLMAANTTYYWRLKYKLDLQQFLAGNHLPPDTVIKGFTAIVRGCGGGSGASWVYTPFAKWGVLSDTTNIAVGTQRGASSAAVTSTPTTMTYTSTDPDDIDALFNGPGIGFVSPCRRTAASTAASYNYRFYDTYIIIDYEYDAKPESPINVVWSPGNETDLLKPIAEIQHVSGGVKRKITGLYGVIDTVKHKIFDLSAPAAPEFTSLYALGDSIACGVGASSGNANKNLAYPCILARKMGLSHTPASYNLGLSGAYTLWIPDPISGTATNTALITSGSYISIFNQLSSLNIPNEGEGALILLEGLYNDWYSVGQWGLHGYNNGLTAAYIAANRAAWEAETAAASPNYVYNARTWSGGTSPFAAYNAAYAPSNNQMLPLSSEGGLYLQILNIKTRFPKAKIVFLLPYNNDLVTGTTPYQAISNWVTLGKAICDMMSVPWIDLYELLTAGNEVIPNSELESFAGQGTGAANDPLVKVWASNNGDFAGLVQAGSSTISNIDNVQIWGYLAGSVAHPSKYLQAVMAKVIYDKLQQINWADYE